MRFRTARNFLAEGKVLRLGKAKNVLYTAIHLLPLAETLLSMPKR